MLANSTAQLVCRHGTPLESCSLCQPSLPSCTHQHLNANLNEFLQEARPRLLRLARLNGIEADAAEDVVQETCFEAWRHLEKLREPEHFAVWLAHCLSKIFLCQVHRRPAQPGLSRAPVKKSRSVLKISLKQLGTSQNVQVVDDGTAAEVEEILACATIACPPSLPSANMGQGMLNGHSFTEFGWQAR